ncbi:MAG: tyrosine recombinase [Nitrospinota bacterium]
MKESLERFLEFLRVEKRLSENTLIAYGRDVGAFLAHAEKEGVGTPGELVRPVLLSHLKALADSGLSPASVRRKVAAVRRFCRFLKEEATLGEDMASELRSPAAWRRLPRVLSEEEVALLIAQPDPRTPRGVRDAALLELLYATGVRASELVGLRLNQVHLEAGFLLALGKGSRERVVPVGEAALARLRNYLEGAREALLRGKRSEFLFVSARGKPLTRQGFWKLLRHYALRAGLRRGVGPHMVRHSFASHLLARGADLRALQLMLGHADIATTEVYTHLQKGHLRAALEARHPRKG